MPPCPHQLFFLVTAILRCVTSQHTVHSTYKSLKTNDVEHLFRCLLPYL